MERLCIFKDVVYGIHKRENTSRLKPSEDWIGPKRLTVHMISQLSFIQTICTLLRQSRAALINILILTVVHVTGVDCEERTDSAGAFWIVV